MDPIDEINNKYQCFSKQADAYEVQKKKPGRRCFSVELPNSAGPQGALRRFLLSDLAGFWMWYRNEYNGPRHFYEVIQEGYPCRLYFDLEYQKEDNPNLVEKEILESFINLINKLVEEHFNFNISKKNWMLLNSTTETKFSAHAVVHFPENYIFPNNVAMRIFIQAVLQKMSDTGIGIIKKEDQETFICDPAVYTKNRVFRLFLSSKAGKKIFLKLMDGCTFYDKPPKDDRTIFLDSLVVPYNYKTCPTLKIPENPYIVLKQTRMNGPMKTASLHSIVSRPHVHQNCQNPGLDIDIIRLSSGISPLHELDEFVVQFNRRFVPNVAIRVWQFMIMKSTGSKRVQYQFTNCRYCLKMGREHKSNNVYWTVNLEEMYMFQRCFDCRDFVSSYFELPEKLIEKISPKINSAFLKTENESFSEEIRKKSLDDSIFSIDPEEASRDIDDEIQVLPKRTKVLMDSFNDPEYEEKIVQLLKKPEKRRRVMIKTDDSGKKFLVDLTDDIPEAKKVKKETPQSEAKPKTKVFLSNGKISKIRFPAKEVVPSRKAPEIKIPERKISEMGTPVKKFFSNGRIPELKSPEKKVVELKSPEKKIVSNEKYGRKASEEEITCLFPNTPKKNSGNPAASSRIQKIKPSPEIL